MIGIFGDSFASGEHEPDPSRHGWPRFFAQLLNEQFVNEAQPSTSIWWSYERFLKNHKKYDKIVFTYSHYSRWSYLPEHLAKLSLIRPRGIRNSPGIDSHHDESLKKYVDILLKAHPILYSDELQLFTYQNIFNSVNKLCRENNIKLVNLMPFEHNSMGTSKFREMYINTSNATGTCLTNLVDISRNEAIDKHNVFHHDLFMGAPVDKRASHISLENNKVLASIITETFYSDKIEVKNLCEDPRFLKGTFFNEN